MTEPADYGLMLTTTPTRDEAAKIAKLLIDEKLAACVQLMPIESFYVWQGATQNEPETLLLIKTRAALFDRTRDQHPQPRQRRKGRSVIARSMGRTGYRRRIHGSARKAAGASPEHRHDNLTDR